MGFSGDFMVFHGVFNGCCSDSVVGKQSITACLGCREARSSLMAGVSGTYINIYMYLYIYVYICIYICIYINVYIYSKHMKPHEGC